MADLAPEIAQYLIETDEGAALLHAAPDDFQRTIFTRWPKAGLVTLQRALGIHREVMLEEQAVLKDLKRTLDTEIARLQAAAHAASEANRPESALNSPMVIRCETCGYKRLWWQPVTCGHGRAA